MIMQSLRFLHDFYDQFENKHKCLLLCRGGNPYLTYQFITTPKIYITPLTDEDKSLKHTRREFMNKFFKYYYQYKIKLLTLTVLLVLLMSLLAK